MEDARNHISVRCMHWGMVGFVWDGMQESVHLQRSSGRKIYGLSVSKGGTRENRCCGTVVPMQQMPAYLSPIFLEII